MSLKFLLIPLFASLAFAQAPDLRRNQRVQKLASEVLKAQRAYDGEMKAWMAECEAKGLTLRPVAGNLMDCVPNPQAAPKPAPKPNGETK